MGYPHIHTLALKSSACCAAHASSPITSRQFCTCAAASRLTIHSTKMTTWRSVLNAQCYKALTTSCASIHASSMPPNPRMPQMQNAREPTPQTEQVCTPGPCRTTPECRNSTKTPSSKPPRPLVRLIENMAAHIGRLPTSQAPLLQEVRCTHQLI